MLFIVSNGTDLNKLREAQIERANAVIAVTNDPERESVYQELGIDTICPTILSSKVIDNLLENCPEKEALS